ncbi:CpsD/CapB family tyrosine-protein kinase [Actinoplanes bogorensis]|uniref:CpsD/CapB family tyrosine-protein kinase n=1 Tax=Paractinoplanes bogorensis TaxID=1610840 RepID=A0ABS5YL53_9ACTN|nr:CpsD/CapB family tyrosine-protein kinase [Actinoplanes bogorensis]MBU2664195.1 CpsD/CapB family tyrosine-protein kinase [Actinoplanes bogorensis]
MTVLITAGAYAASRAEKSDFRSAATAVASPRLRAGIDPVPANPGTEREIARSGTVLRAVATELKISEDELAGGLSVETADSGGAAVVVAYTDRDAAVAQQRAQAVATEYVRYRNTSTSQYGIAASLVSPAGPAVEQRTPLWIPLAAGALAGLLLGLLSAWGLARRRDRIRGRAHFERETGVKVLATIPRARRPRGPGAPLPVLLRAPGSADAESYRYLRARLEPRLKNPATVLVAGARDGEGRSTTAANLAVALAQAGRRVALIDTDVRHPALHLMFDLSRDRGLTNVLAGEHSLAETLAAGAIVNLRVLAAGALRDGGPDLLAAGGLAGLLHELKQQCDVVLLDSPALLGVADALALAGHSDHVLLVTDYRRTSRAAAVLAASELEQVAPGRVAAVLIGVPERDGGLIPRTGTGRAPAGPALTPPVDRFAVLEGPGDEDAHAAPRAPSAPPDSAPLATPRSTALPSARPVSATPAQPVSAAPAPAAQPVSDQPAPEQPKPEPERKKPARPARAKVAIPKPRVYTSAAKAEAEARVQAKAAAEAVTEDAKAEK